VKKLDYNHLTTGALTVDASHLIGVVNDLIDLVNSQQDLVNSQQEAIKELRAGNSRDTQHQHDNVEAIGELQTEIGVLRNMVLQSQEAIEKLQEHVDHEARHVSEQADDTQLIAGYTIEELKKIADTHRTEKVDPRDMASRNPSPEAKKALETAVQEAQEDINRISTHRTVTLRIPRGMTISNAMWEIRYRIEPIDYFWEMSDTELQKALDEVQPNE